MLTWSHIFVGVLGDIRNDLYLTLERGDFERGGKSVQKNIEVTVYVLYADGEILKVYFGNQIKMKNQIQLTPAKTFFAFGEYLEFFFFSSSSFWNEECILVSDKKSVIVCNFFLL